MIQAFLPLPSPGAASMRWNRQFRAADQPIRTSQVIFGVREVAAIFDPQANSWLVGVAFSSLARIWGECSTSHSPPNPFFFEVAISSRTLIPLFMPGLVPSGSAGLDDCGRMFSDKLRVSSFPDRFPHYTWTAA